MRRIVLVVLAFGVVAGLPARADEVPGEAARFGPETLREIVAPVALYPDLLLASILPASTAPLDVVLAARRLEAAGGAIDPEAVQALAFDPAVKSLMQYPELLFWLSDNVTWLVRLGQAVTLQSEEVLAAIQDVRRTAAARGQLRTDEHMVVRSEAVPMPPDLPSTLAVGARQPTVIVVEPAHPRVVYVPCYDPVLVLRTSVFTRPAITFCFGFTVGLFTYHTIDWVDHCWRWWWWPRWRSRYSVAGLRVMIGPILLQHAYTPYRTTVTHWRPYRPVPATVHLRPRAWRPSTAARAAVRYAPSRGTVRVTPRRPTLVSPRPPRVVLPRSFQWPTRVAPGRVPGPVRPSRPDLPPPRVRHVPGQRTRR